MTLRVWTIQPILVWERLQREGIVWVDPAQRLAEVSLALNWLVKKLQTRIPLYSGHLPWWAYGKKPDLRVFRHRLFGPQVRIELELPHGTYLGFPSWAWHRVLTWQSLIDDEPMWKAENAAKPPRAVIETWDRLFDAKLTTQASDAVLGAIDEYEIVFERLDRKNVIQVTCFSGTNQQLKQILDRQSLFG